MKLPYFLTAALALLAFTAGGGRELSDVELVEALCIDGSGPVTVTAVGREGTYAAGGHTVPVAQAGLAGQGEKRLEVTHVRQIILGEGADVPAALWQELTCRESGSGATVWLCAGEAAALVSATEEEIPRRLQTLEEGGGAEAPVLLATVARLSQGETVRLPVLAAEEGKLTVKGYRTVKGAVPFG